jgi:4-amino-4-deoxy-L-arabinose transferase-like glycosyltransferase
MTPRQSGILYKRLSSEKIYFLLFAGIIAVGLFLRLYQLGADELWLDEAMTGFIALTRDWLDYLRIATNPPLYFIMQRGWCGLVTCDEFGLRLSSALFGVLFIVLAGILCRRLYGRKIALAVALVAAVSPIHVYYSQEARVYVVLMTVLLLFLYLQWRVIREGSTAGSLIGLFCITLIALFLHYFSLIVIWSCLFIYALETLYGLRRVPRGYYLAVIAATVIFIPWLYFSIFSSHSTSTELGWIAQYLDGKSAWQLPLRSVTTYLVGPQYYNNEINLFLKRYSYVSIPAALHLFNIFFTYLFLCLYALILVRYKRLPRESRLLFLETSAFVILPLLGLLTASLLLTPMYVVGRYDMIAYPAFLVLVGCMMHILLHWQRPSSAVPYRVAMAGLFSLFIAAQAYKVMAYKFTAPYGSMKPHVDAMLERIHDGDGLLIADPDATLIWYYMHAAGYNRHGDQCMGHGKRFTCRLFPKRLEQAPASQDRYLSLYHTNRPSFNIDYFLDELTPRSSVVLMLAHVNLKGDEIELDPVGLKLVTELVNAGYRNNGMSAVDTVDNLITFSKNSGATGAR